MKLLFTFLILAVGLFFGEPTAHADPLSSLFVFGAVINQGVLESAYKGFQVIFQEALDGAKTQLDTLALHVTSSSKQEEYKWLGQFPGLREWIGERVVKDLSVDGFVIKNRDFEATISVDRNDFEDDSIGIYRPLMQGLGESAKQHPDSLLFELMINGFSGIGFDTVPFFSTNHPNGKQANWSNMGTSVLTSASYATARSQIMSLVNDENRPLKVLPNFLIVPPQLEATARAILKADKAANGSSNIWLESADIMVVPELATNPTYWFLADLSKNSIKPLIFQDRRKPQFVSLDNVTDDNVFMHKEYIYGVDYRGNAGYGFPHLMFGSNGTV